MSIMVLVETSPNDYGNIRGAFTQTEWSRVISEVDGSLWV